MSLFKHLKSTGQGGAALRSPGDVAKAICAAAEPFAVLRSLEAAPNGFINVWVDDAWVVGELMQVGKDNKIVPLAVPKRKIAVDFSSPNIAKEMHVGHLRSSIIGECLCRALEFQGHEVLRINHTGDWGTQFGMLITHLLDEHPNFTSDPPNISDLNVFYKASKQRFDADEDFKTRAHAAVVRLQSGGETELKCWKCLCDISRAMFQQVYARLDVVTHECGESFYNPLIPAALDELQGAGLITLEDNGAKLVWLEGWPAPQGPPLIVQKGDGGYGYDSTDITAIKYRFQELEADRLIYVTDAGQRTHFELIFAAAEKMRWPQTKFGEGNYRIDHCGFGLVCGKDGKKYKTRSGEVTRLVDLLDEAVRRVKFGHENEETKESTMGLAERVEKKMSYLDPADIDEAAAIIGYVRAKRVWGAKRSE